jgi:hypothetical protein
MNKETGFCLNKSWKPLICSLKKIPQATQVLPLHWPTGNLASLPPPPSFCSDQYTPPANQFFLTCVPRYLQVTDHQVAWIPFPPITLSDLVSLVTRPRLNPPSPHEIFPLAHSPTPPPSYIYSVLLTPDQLQPPAHCILVAIHLPWRWRWYVPPKQWF